MTTRGAVPRSGQHSEEHRQLRQPPNDPPSVGTRQSRDHCLNLTVHVSTTGDQGLHYHSCHQSKPGSSGCNVILFILSLTLKLLWCWNSIYSHISKYRELMKSPDCKRNSVPLYYLDQTMLKKTVTRNVRHLEPTCDL